VDDFAKDRRPLRIADIAAMAGVSTATVSRALTSPEKLRAGTLARVNEAVARTGYTPNLAARVLRARRTMVVLVVVPDIANPFFSDVLRGIDESLSGAGYGWLIGNLGNSREKAQEIVDIVQSGQVDGVLLLNGSIPEYDGRSLSSLGVPMVAVCEAIPGADFPQVEAQNLEAAREGAVHLLSLGHRRLAYLAGPSGNILEQQRRAGFCEALVAAGVALRSVRFYPGDFTFAAGRAAATGFLAATVRPTALFAANDEMAIGFLKTVRTAGLAVPGDISILGFDGIAFADFVEPTLTTLRQPRQALGQAGASLLVKAMTGVPVTAAEAHIRLPVPLLARASTGPASDGGQHRIR
jgi:LacI family repressor for deo operon, udp, cdd, tsx, nupC, and nupG